MRGRSLDVGAGMLPQSRAPLDSSGWLRVLILCTGNSARSQMAECLVDRIGAGRLRGHSAGSHPTGAVHPLALEVLASHGHEPRALRSKSWHEFAVTGGASALDFVFTVCDSAASESCPIWPGRPVSAHWPVPDPAAVVGTDAERREAFEHAYAQLEERTEAFAALLLEDLTFEDLRARLEETPEPAHV